MNRWRPITWIFLAVNLGFALWVLVPAISTGRAPSGPLFAWVVIDVLMVMFWIVTRPKTPQHY